MMTPTPTCLCYVQRVLAILEPPQNLSKIIFRTFQNLQGTRAFLSNNKKRFAIINGCQSLTDINNTDAVNPIPL